MSLLHQTVGKKEFVSYLDGFNKILKSDQKGDEEMYKGDFYGH